MKKIIVLSLAVAAFLGAKEIKSANIFLSDAKSVTDLGAFLKANKDAPIKIAEKRSRKKRRIAKTGNTETTYPKPTN